MFTTLVTWNTEHYEDGQWADKKTIKSNIEFADAESMYNFHKYIEDIRKDNNASVIPQLKPSHTLEELKKLL